MRFKILAGTLVIAAAVAAAVVLKPRPRKK